MSQKINGKNLSYNSSLPPFLAALHAQAAGHSGPDPILGAQRRAAKKRSGSEEAEDAPLVVDEAGNAVDYEVNKDGTVRNRNNDGKEDGNEAVEGSDTLRDAESERKPEETSKAAIGGRKRKVGKVVGDAAEETDKNDRSLEKRNASKDGAPADKKSKKKAKKIKLSFDEEEG